MAAPRVAAPPGAKNHLLSNPPESVSPPACIPLFYHYKRVVFLSMNPVSGLAGVEAAPFGPARRARFCVRHARNVESDTFDNIAEISHLKSHTPNSNGECRFESR